MTQERIKKTFEIETSPDVMARFERLLAMMHYNSAWGHTATFAMPLDGDGADRMIVSPTPEHRTEVGLIGGVGGSIEVAYDGSFGCCNAKELSSDWTVKDSILYRDGEVHTDRS